MPDESPEEREVEEIVHAVEAGTDGIVVPEELIVEPDQKAPAKAPIARSLYAEILAMTVAEKIKLALRGNKDARAILIRDANKLIRRLVFLNPRISDGEVLAVARNRTADEDLIRMITERREWIKNYQIRLALATNPKTPLVIALKHIRTLDERDIRQIAKSRNVPQTVAAQARRILFGMPSHSK
jgi:hypothetical protein